MWIELAIEVPSAAAEVLADAVGELTGGVELRDAETILRVQGGRSLIVALATPEAEAEVLAEVEAACARLRAAGVSPDPMKVARREAHEDEWRDIWKRYFRTLRVGKSFIIRPSWEPPADIAGDRVIDIDPGRAFGTGGHASTRLVIAMAEELAEARERSPALPDEALRGRSGTLSGFQGGGRVGRFVDLGCGSGILSIAATLLWPGARGLALDVDSEAVATTIENLALNHVTTVDARVGSLADVPLSPPCDVMLANIEATVLVPLAPAFPACLAPDAAVILSGLLSSDVDAVMRAYEAVGFELDARRDEDEWSALRLRRARGRMTRGRRLFVPPAQLAAERLTVTAADHRHLARVLRVQPGDSVTLFDGAGNEMEARVTRVGRAETELLVVAASPRSGAAREPTLVLLTAVPRGPRMDLLVEKTCELGVSRIVPVLTERSVARPDAARRGRWEKIAREAARQCGRADVPEVEAPIALAAALEAPELPRRRLMAWEGEGDTPLRSRPDSGAPTALLVGPEGGFTAAEVEAARHAGFDTVTLGRRILRVETAAMLAVALVRDLQFQPPGP